MKDSEPYAALKKVLRPAMETLAGAIAKKNKQAPVKAVSKPYLLSDKLELPSLDAREFEKGRSLCRGSMLAPDAYDIRIVPSKIEKGMTVTKESRFDFTYCETMYEPSKAVSKAAKATVKLLSPTLKMLFGKSGKVRIEEHVVGPYQDKFIDAVSIVVTVKGVGFMEIADFVTSEFMCFSRAGTVTLADIMVSATVGRMQGIQLAEKGKKR